MAKIYQPTYWKDGKKHKYQFWYVRIPKPGGGYKKTRLSKDKKASEIMVADILRKIEMGRAGAIDPFAEHAATNLAVHAEKWVDDLRYNGSGEKNIRASTQLLERVFGFIGADYPADVTPGAVKKYLLQYRTENDVGPRTMNWQLSRLKAFFAWMVRDKRMAESPVAGIAKVNEKADVRHERRPLTRDELERLVSAADASERVFRGLDGRDRGTLYTLAATTGFRVEELSVLTPESFVLDGETPTATLAASQTKNGEEAIQPLPPSTVARMRAHFQRRAVGGKVWAGTWVEKSAKMLRYDLAAAKIPYVVTVAGTKRYADFHGLRHTFVWMLKQAGVSLGDAMQLSRHSDPRLTMAIYGRSSLEDLSRAVNRIERGQS